MCCFHLIHYEYEGEYCKQAWIVGQTFFLRGKGGHCSSFLFIFSQDGRGQIVLHFYHPVNGPPMNPEKVETWTTGGLWKGHFKVEPCVVMPLCAEQVGSWKSGSLSLEEELEENVFNENWLALYTKVFEALFHERENLKERDFSLVQSDKLCLTIQ